MYTNVQCVHDYMLEVLFEHFVDRYDLLEYAWLHIVAAELLSRVKCRGTSTARAEAVQCMAHRLRWLLAALVMEQESELVLMHNVVVDKCARAPSAQHTRSTR